MPDCSCPRIDEGSWQDTEHDWGGRSFYTRRTPMFMHVPFRIGADIEKAISDIRTLGLRPSQPSMVLSKDALFRGEVLLGVETQDQESKDLVVMPEHTIVHSRVYHGQWRHIAGPTRRMVKDLKSGGLEVAAVYYWYITCAKCADQRGYRTVIIARLA
jgi:hypothetical protein